MSGIDDEKIEEIEELDDDCDDDNEDGLENDEREFLNTHTALFSTFTYKIDIAGISQRDEKGVPTRRQALNKLERHEPLVLERDRNNQYDINAIKILTSSGHQLGWVPKSFAPDMAADLDSGRIWVALFPATLADSGNYLATAWVLRMSVVENQKQNPTNQRIKTTRLSAGGLKSATCIITKDGEANNA